LNRSAEQSPHLSHCAILHDLALDESQSGHAPHEFTVEHGAPEGSIRTTGCIPSKLQRVRVNIVRVGNQPPPVCPCNFAHSMEEVRLRALHLRQDERAPPQHCGQRLQQMPQAPSNEGFANMTRQQNAGAPARSFMPHCIDDGSGKMDSHRTFETACCILHTLFPECSFNQARLDEPVNPIATLTIGQP
jgi:hypothetical protein